MVPTNKQPALGTSHDWENLSRGECWVKEQYREQEDVLYHKVQMMLPMPTLYKCTIFWSHISIRELVAAWICLLLFDWTRTSSLDWIRRLKARWQSNGKLVLGSTGLYLHGHGLLPKQPDHRTQELPQGKRSSSFLLWFTRASVSLLPS